MFVFTFLSIQRKIGLLKASRSEVKSSQENLKMRFFNFIFILTKCQANMCEGATDPNQVGSLNRHYRDLYDYPAKILCSATFQRFNKWLDRASEYARVSSLKQFEEFYQKHHHAEGKSVYFAGGAESVIYKCSTDDKLSSQLGFNYQRKQLIFL